MTGQTKRCTRCGDTKPLNAFYPNRAPTRGRPSVKSVCRDCDNSARVAAKQEDTPPKPPLPTAAEMRAWYRAGCPVA